MPTYAEFGATKLDPRVAGSNVEAPPEEDGLAVSLRKGFDSGMSGAGSQLHSVAGLVGQNLGYDDFAAARNADALRLQQQAQREAPAIGSYKQVLEKPSLRNAGNYVAGLIGGSLPVMGAGVAGGLATGGAGVIPSMLGAAAATAPFEMGDVIQKQNADPEAMKATPGIRLRDAALGGGASALLQGIVPGAVAGKVAGRSVKGMMAHNLMDIPVEAVSEGGGEAVKQFGANQNKPLDWEAIKENAVGGAAAGGAFGAVGAAGDLVHGAAPGARDALGSAAGALEARLKPSKEEPGTPVDDAKPTSRFQSAWNDLQDLAGMGKTKLDDSVKRVKEGIPLGDLKEFGTAQGQRLSDMTDFSASEGLKKATQWGEEMLNDAGLTPERRQAVTEAMSKVGDRAGQMTMAGLKEAQDWATETMGKIKAFHDTWKRRDIEGEVREVPETKLLKSEDLRGATEAVVREIVPMLKKSNPSLVESADGINLLAPALVSTVKAMQQGPLSSDRIARLIDLLGDDTNRVLVKLDEMFGAKDPAKVEAFFKQVQDIDGVQKRTDDLDQLVRSSLTPEAQDTTLSSMVPHIVEKLRNITRGQVNELGPKSARGTMLTSEFRKFMTDHFGAAADRVSKAFEKEAKLNLKDEAGAKNPLSSDDAKFDENGDRIEQAEPDVMKFGLTKPDKAGHSKSALNGLAMPEDSRYARQHLSDLKGKYPGHDVRFERVPGSDHGHIIVENRANPGEFSAADLKAMAHDTNNYYESPSRLTIGDHNIDAVRVAKVMSKRANKDFKGDTEVSSVAHTVDMFKRGIAQLTAQFGENVHVPDDAVIGFSGKKPIMWGDAQRIVGDTAEDRMSKSGKRKLEALRRVYKGADEAARADIIEEVQALVKNEKDRELTADLDTRTTDSEVHASKMDRTRLRDVKGNRKPKKDYESPDPHESKNSAYDDEGNLTKGGAEMILQGDTHGGIDVAAPSKSLHELDRKSHDSGQGRTEVGKDENIHLASAAIDEKDLVNRANMDGTGHSNSDYVPKEFAERAKEFIANMRKWDKSAPAKAIAKRAKTLIESMHSMTEVDQHALLDLRKLSAGDATPEVNRLAKKYMGQVSESKKPPIVQSVKVEGASEKLLLARLEYLNNPPSDYTSAKGRAELARAKAELKTATHEGVRTLLRQIIKKAESMGEGDASLAAKEGTPDPKAVAAKKAAFLEKARSGDAALIESLKTSTDAKGLQRAAEIVPPGPVLDVINTRLGELVQDPDAAYGLQTKKYSLVGTLDNDGRRSKLITRLADGRRGRFISAPSTGVFRSGRGEDTFGPLGDGFTYYHSADSDHTVTAAVPTELVARLEKYLSTARPEKIADAIAVFGVQHVVYDIATGDVTTFGPAPNWPGAEVLRKLGALGETGKSTSSGDGVTRVEGVNDSETAKFLATALAYSKQVLGKDELPVNWTRVTGGNEGKKGSGKFSAQSTGTGPQNPASRAGVATYLDRVLGASVRRAWANLTHAGEFDTVTNTIRLSIHALDPMSVAYHESLHAFFKQLKDSRSDDIAAVLLKASESRHVIDQMTAFFKNEPNVLAQLADREERAAYMYQMWAAGQLTVNTPTRTLFQRIAKYVRELMGVWSNDERALHIMEYFNTGEYAKNLGSPNAVRRALMEPGRNQAYEMAKSFTEPMAHIADAIVSTGSGRMRDTGVPSLIKLADIIKREHTAEGGDQGYIAAARIEGTKRRTAMGETLKSFSKETLDTAMEGLHNGTHSLDANVRDAQDRLKAILRRTKNYMHQAGVDLGDLKADYFPRVWDTHYISKHQQEFLDMLAPYERAGHGSAKSMLNALMSHEGNEFQTETNIPGMQFTKTRLWNFITPQDASMFVTKDLMGTMSSYITQATRRAEWERRLGGGKLEQMFNKARQEGATDDDLKLTTDYLKGVDGTLGDSLNPTARRLMGNMIVYQNVRLLPLAVFSSIVDPVGVMVRGGTMGDAWTTFKRGVSEIPANFGRKTREDDASRMAELVGVVDSAMLTHTMGDLYTQGMVGGTAQKINNAFFRFNLMEGLNRSFRVGATEAAAKFMQRHADGTASRHSARWMNELGLQAGDVKTVNGRMALTAADGLTAEQVLRVHAALNQWVDGAVLRPDAADKPVWMNDPHYALISHLKQFVYSFQKTIIDRVVHEAEHGNYSPVMALASYVPIMIAADTAKGIIQGGGDTPEWKKGWGMGDYIGYGAQRAGLLGVGQFGYDVMQNAERGGTGVGALVGPTFEQLGDVITALNGKKQFGPVVLHAMPANALYSGALGGGSATPTPIHDA